MADATIHAEPVFPRVRTRGLTLPAILWALAITCRFTATAASSSVSDSAALNSRFSKSIRPFLETYCLDCHNPQKRKGKLDLSRFDSPAAVAKDFPQWDVLLQKLQEKEMPPEEAEHQPSAEERQTVMDWVQQWRRFEAQRQAGDPGPVPPRRLSNAEYNYTIRDLTGVDLRPTQEFPVDPANEAGFDNSGQSLAMSPALVAKYMDAARFVASHLVLNPTGFVFAPHPALTETDRDKFCVNRIVDFYRKQPTDYADYFMASWRFQHRVALGQPEATLDSLARLEKVSPKYLRQIWNALSATNAETGPLGRVRTEFHALPVPTLSHVNQDIESAQAGCRHLRDSILEWHRQIQFPNVDLAVKGTAKESQPLVLLERRRQIQFTNVDLSVKGISKGSQPLVLWKNRQAADRRMRAPEGSEDLGLEAFCLLFPDAFYMASRAHYSEPDLGKDVRLLSAGFHLMQGYFRDDQPLCQLILDENGNRQLDTLWRDLDFITAAPMRQYKDFVFFERAEPPRFMQGEEFDFARSEDKDVTSEANMRRLAEAYLAKAKRNGASAQAVGAIEDYFARMSADIRWVEQTRRSAEPSQISALLDFAQRAWRRPLTELERQDNLAFYHKLRSEGLDHEEALRDSVASMLMSPHFSFRIQETRSGDGPGSLTDISLANRLSYFLWASMPDEELMTCASSGQLSRPEILLAQTRRMLADERIRALATEFGGNLLDIRRFEEHNGVDRERFKEFSNDLRQAMFEEPMRFLEDLMQRDGSLLDMLEGDYTFVNPLLAEHYGMPVPDLTSGGWIRVNEARRYGRGGLLPMAAFLTKNAPGLRTSPVKRGYWVARRLLGERIPPPPAEVPELPKDEAATGDLSLPQLLARHRDNPSCAGCHKRFDSLGLAFESYGPVGERRERDLAGRPVENRAVFPDGSTGVGLEGLRNYMRQKRQEEFVDHMCRQLLSYALGRTLLISDDPLVEEMRDKLRAEGYRFGSLVASIVTSRQFLTARGP